MQPVRAFEQELADVNRAEMTAFRNRREIWEMDRKRILGDKAKRAAREADLEALGPEPQGPLHPFIVVAEPTLEGITKNIPLLRPSLGIFSDEGGAFLGGHSMSSENRMRTVSGLSSMWDGTSATRLRAADIVPTAAGRRVTVHLMVQPVVALEILSDPLANGQGFLARFLPTEPPSAIGTRTRTEVSAASERRLDEFNARILELLRQALPLREGTRNELDPPLLPLSESARAKLQNFFLLTEEAQGSGRPLEGVRPFASKAAEHAARLAAVLTVYAGEEEVSETTMVNAVRLVGYYVRETIRLTDAAKVSKTPSNAEKVLHWLQNVWWTATSPSLMPSKGAELTPRSERDRATMIPVEGGAMVGG